MADIITVRKFTTNLRKLEVGKSYIVVDGVRNKIITTITVQNNPPKVVQTIEKVYTS